MKLRSVQQWLRTEGPVALTETEAPAVVRWARTNPTAVDTALAVLVFAATLPQVLFHARASDPMIGAYAVMSILLTAPLTYRRRRPFLVFLAVTVVGGVQWLIGIQLTADVSVLIALATVAASYPFRAALLAAAVTEFAAAAAAWRWPHGLRVTEMLTILSVFVVAATMSGAYVRSRRRLIRLLRQDRTRLRRDRGRLAELAVADERVRIARDMHDVVGHALTVIVTLAAASAGKAGKLPDRVDDAVALIEQTARSALTDTRTAIRGYRSDDEVQPTPSLSDIGGLLDAVEAAGLRTTIEMNGDAADVPTAVGVCAYRIAQEAVTNTLRHSGACNVAVTIGVMQDHLHLSLEDDGAKHDMPVVGPVGSGILGMRERVASVGGTLSVGPGTDGGWRVSATMPLTPQHLGRMA